MVALSAFELGTPETLLFPSMIDMVVIGVRDNPGWSSLSRTPDCTSKRTCLCIRTHEVHLWRCQRKEVQGELFLLRGTP